MHPCIADPAGELSFEGWTVSKKLLDRAGAQASVGHDALRPQISQKGVDMRIGMDIAALTLKNRVGIIVLVTVAATSSLP